MDRRSNVLKVAGVSFVLTLTACLCAFQAQTQDAGQDNSNFDFSVYYTGNVRGNLEPCG